MFCRKIVIAGGTGALGRILGAYLVKNGWDVVVLGRAATLRESLAGVRYRQWDGRTVGQWADELEGAAAVVNLAGRTVNCRYTRRNRQQILDSRIHSTRVLGEAIARCSQPPRVWLNSSTATIYKHATGRANDELHGLIGATPEAHDAFSIHVATTWEKTLFEAQTHGIRKIALRTAIVIGEQPGTVLPILRRVAALGLGGRMASGEQWVSWIHELDFCRAVEWLINSDLHGVVNLAAPTPLSNAEMMRIVRHTSGGIGQWIGLPAARWMLRIGTFFLRTEAELLLKSRRVIPGRLTAAGFRFDFETFQEATATTHKSRQASHAAAVAGFDGCKLVK